MTQGIIQKDGHILADDGKIHEPDMIYHTSRGLTILLVCSSYSRYHIDEVVGKRVEFVLSMTGLAYNFKLIN
jgi:hypothetical protein